MHLVRLLGATLLATAGLAAAAGCGKNGSLGPCEGATPDPTCALACDTVSNPCPVGYYCAPDGTCNAECVQGAGGCEDNEVCTNDGHCEVPADADCPDVSLTGERTTPTVQLLLDQSGSMTADFGGGLDRWDAMVEALIDPQDGVVTQNAAAVIFGASLYTYDSNAGGACPDITGVPRSANNLAAISALLNGADPVAETPTGDSIDVIVADFLANPPPAGSPPIIVLATDGEPDTCEQPNPQNGQAEAIAAARAAYAAGIRLYILGVSDDVGAPHLQDMANAGVGNDPQVTGNQAPYFTANSPAELSAQLQSIIGGVISCELDLDGAIDPNQVSSGTVVLGGTTLVFGSDWELVDADTIRLTGGACDDLLADPGQGVTATFPCGVVVD